ncbi:hypothetical protein DM684_08895 [Salmonella bongori]|nr:hypothetical protein [Salmonella bongori]ECI3518198.1 hypothetical protein [Salmonella bongori]
MRERYKFNNKFHNITNYFNLCDPDRLNTFKNINLNRDLLKRYIYEGDYCFIYCFIISNNQRLLYATIQFPVSRKDK